MIYSDTTTGAISGDREPKVPCLSPSDGKGDCATEAWNFGLFFAHATCSRTPSDSKGQYSSPRGRKQTRLLTSQRSQTFSGIGRNGQMGNDASRPRYGRPEDEADVMRAVAVKVAEVREVSLLGLSYVDTMEKLK